MFIAEHNSIELSNLTAGMSWTSGSMAKLLGICSLHRRSWGFVGVLSLFLLGFCEENESTLDLVLGAGSIAFGTVELNNLWLGHLSSMPKKVETVVLVVLVLAVSAELKLITLL